MNAGALGAYEINRLHNHQEGLLGWIVAIALIVAGFLIGLGVPLYLSIHFGAKAASASRARRLSEERPEDGS